MMLGNLPDGSGVSYWQNRFLPPCHRSRVRNYGLQIVLRIKAVCMHLYSSATCLEMPRHFRPSLKPGITVPHTRTDSLPPALMSVFSLSAILISIARIPVQSHGIILRSSCHVSYMIKVSLRFENKKVPRVPNGNG